MEVTINAVDLAFRLSYNRLIEEYETEQSLYKEQEFDNECLVYTDGIQELKQYLYEN